MKVQLKRQPEEKVKLREQPEEKARFVDSVFGGRCTQVHLPVKIPNGARCATELPPTLASPKTRSPSFPYRSLV